MNLKMRMVVAVATLLCVPLLVSAEDSFSGKLGSFNLETKKQLALVHWTSEVVGHQLALLALLPLQQANEDIGLKLAMHQVELEQLMAAEECFVQKLPSPLPLEKGGNGFNKEADSYTGDPLTFHQAEFELFAQNMVQEMNRNLAQCRSRMQISKIADGSYTATYREIDDQSLNYQVRTSSSKTAPYVGVMGYEEKVYTADCESPEACRQATFREAEVIPNRHIFTYSKGSWK